MSRRVRRTVALALVCICYTTVCLLPWVLTL